MTNVNIMDVHSTLSRVETEVHRYHAFLLKVLGRYDKRTNRIVLAVVGEEPSIQTGTSIMTVIRRQGSPLHQIHEL